MLAVVKTPHTEIRAEGKIPPKVLQVLKLAFGKKLHIEEDEDDEKRVNIRDTDWWKDMDANWHPGKSVNTYRELKGWTLEALGKKLGGLSRQNVHDIESGRRGISKAIAKKLSLLFNRPVERFL